MTMITPSYLGETIEYSSLHACRSTLEDPTGGWPAQLRDRQSLVDRDSLLANLSVATRVVPRVAQARLLRTWAGFVNATTSWLPVIGELPGCSGLFIGAFPYMGFTAGPLLGRTLAELVCGRRPQADISQFAP